MDDMIKKVISPEAGRGTALSGGCPALDEDCELQGRESGEKRIYKTSKQTLVDQLLHRSRKVPINVNTIIALFK